MSMSENPVLEHWVAESLAGNRDAFGRIVERFQGIVSSVTLGVTGDFQRSEDVAQETFLRAWSKLSELQEPQKIGPWLCAIARNLAKNEAAAHSRFPASDSETVERRAWVAPNSAGASFRDGFSGESLLEALDAIPPKYRESLVLFYREELSVAEIAALLGKPEGTVKQRLYRGRKLLRHEMERLMESVLRQTRPDRSFTLAVVAAIPALATGSGAAIAQTALGTTPLIGAAVSGETTKGGFFAMLAKNSFWLLSVCFWPVLTVGFFIYPLYDTWRTSYDVPSLALRRRMIRGHVMFYCGVVLLMVLAMLFDSFQLRKVFPTLFGGNPVAQFILFAAFLYFFWKALPERFSAHRLLMKEKEQGIKVLPFKSLERLRKFTKTIVVLCSIFVFLYVPICLIFGMKGTPIRMRMEVWILFAFTCFTQIAFSRALRRGFATTKDETAFVQSVEQAGGIEKVTRRYKRLRLTNTVFYGLLALALGWICLAFLRELIANLFWNDSCYIP